MAKQSPRISESDIPGKAYSSLREAWQGYTIALQNDNRDTAKEFASVINGVRAAFGQNPLEFEELDGYKGVSLNQEKPDWETVEPRFNS